MDYLLLPLTSAFAGWFSIWFVLHILFQPKKKKKFLCFSFQGIIPKKQNEISEKIGDIVANDLLKIDYFIKKVNDPKNFTELLPFIESHVHEFLAVKLNEKIPVVSMFIGESTLNKLKEGLMEEIVLLLPEVIKRFTDNLVNELNIKSLVAEKIGVFTSQKLEKIFYTNYRIEIYKLQLFGATVGLIIGLIQIILLFNRM
jgi:uncharacterized membrane protein YheB (UPF0754 family)